MDNLRGFIVILTAYLLGSIPFGYLIVRASEGEDVREGGSGGTGATNVSRRAGKIAGVLTLVLDAMKGAAAVWLANWALGFGFLTDTYWWVAAAGFVAVVGHVFPVWLNFRGGKGVATAVGAFLLLAPYALAGAGLIFLLVVVSTRYVSLGSIIAAAAIPFLIWAVDLYVYPNDHFLPILFAASVSGMLIIFAHRANISRLVAGTESKFK